MSTTIYKCVTCNEELFPDHLGRITHGCLPRVPGPVFQGPAVRSAADVDLGERVESVRQCVSAHLDNLAAHEAWCYAKGRCTYCDPLRDVLALLDGGKGKL